MGKTYGYVRVSTKEQNEDRQVLALNEVEVPKENIYMDKQSGKDFNRPMYQHLLKKIKEGDLLYVKSIDRIGYATFGYKKRTGFDGNISQRYCITGIILCSRE